MKFKIKLNRQQRAFYTIMWERIRTGQYTNDLELEALLYLQHAGKVLMRFALMPTYLPKEIKITLSPAEALALMRLCFYLDLMYHDSFDIERNDIINQILRQAQGIRGFSAASIEATSESIALNNL